MLKYWLPLKKDGRNMGLSPTTAASVSTIGIVTDSACTNGTCATGRCVYHMTEDEFGDEFTIAAWVNNTGSSWYTGNTIVSCKNRNNDTSSTHWYFSIYGGNNLAIGINGAAASKKHAYAFSLNTWYHVAATFDGKNYKLFVNGDSVGSGTITAAKQTGCLNIGINCRSTNANGTDGGSPNYKMFDVRIYNHALNDWEIKKIYNAMSLGINGGLHLKATTNLMAGKDYSVSNLTTNCTTQNDADGGKYVTTTTRIGTYSSDSIRLQFPTTVGFTDGKDYSISYDYKVGAGSGNLHQGLDVNDGTPVVNVTDKESGMKRVEVIVESGAPHYSYNTYRFIDFNKIAQNSKYKIWRMQVEEGKTPTPYTPSHRDERYIDLSGIDNSIISYNITQSGSSFYFNGTNAAIKIPLHEMISGGTWSINLWFYRPNGEFGTKSWETLVGGQSGFELEATSSSTKTLYVCPYSWGGGKFAYEADRWNMVTLTRTSSGSKLYINGSLVKSGSAGSMPSGDYFIGAWKTYTQQNFKGYIRNLSVFQKQLTDEDVMNLYIHGE